MALNTYCSDLWDGFAITKNGNVYSCCLIKPVKIGNIYKKKIRDLINIPKIKQYRLKSLQGNLECFHECNFVRKNKKVDLSNKEIDIDYEDLKRLHISFGEKCNIRCIMCKYPTNNAINSTILNSEILIRNINIEPFEDILIQGGEPLCIKSCIEYLNYLSKMEKRYILLTNGTLINDSMAKKLAKEAKVVVISINAATKRTHERVNVGSSFEKVLFNISNLRKYKEKFGTSVILCGRMTLTIYNLHEIPLFLKKYSELGFDLINFGYDRDKVPFYLNKNQKFKQDLKYKITTVLNNSNLKDIDLQRLYQLDLIGEFNQNVS